MASTQAAIDAQRKALEDDETLAALDWPTPGEDEC